MKAYKFMDEALLSKLGVYYELPLIEKQAIRQSILDAANANPTDFVRLIHEQKFNSTTDILANNLPVFYEALAADLTNWADFFIQEAHRLFTLARTSATPQKILTYLDEFAFIKASEFKNRDALVAILSKELENPNPAFRYYAAWLLPDFIKDTDFKTTDKLRQLLRDPNWRIRYQVYQNLKDLNLLSAQDILSWKDKLRARIWNPYSLD